MRLPYFTAGLLLSMFCNTALAQTSAPARSVESVDLARYVGLWYEIANFPMFFQRNCIGDTTAHYSVLDDGRIAVRNRCRTKNGVDEANGTAEIVPASGNARLKVSFFWPFKGDYWVFALDPDYRWAVVGNPNRKYLWVLSRTPVLPKDQLELALKRAGEQGFKLDELRFTPQQTVTP